MGQGPCRCPRSAKIVKNLGRASSSGVWANLKTTHPTRGSEFIRRSPASNVGSVRASPEIQYRLKALVGQTQIHEAPICSSGEKGAAAGFSLPS